MTKAQERAREIAEEKTNEAYRECPAIKIMRDAFWEDIYRTCLAAYAQGQRDLVEAAKGNGVTLTISDRRLHSEAAILISELAKLAGVDDEIR